MIFLTAVLLVILSLGAVSAQEANNSLQLDSSDNFILNDDSTASVNNDKAVYVETDGDDTGSGSENSPYASINKAISSVNASDNAVIYLGNGNFVGENNTDLSIDLAHKNYNGSLTIIGQGSKTVIDANGTSQIFKSISADSIVTLMNITFINGKGKLGSAISNSGDLTIDGCTFENNSAITYATVYQDDSNNLRIYNSVFKGNRADSGNSAVYFSEYSDSKKFEVEIVNSTFINGTTEYNWADSSCVFIENPNYVLVENNRFISTSGTGKGSALYARSNNGKVIKNTFKDCSYDGSNDGAILYIAGNGVYLEGNTFENFTSTQEVPIYALMNFNAKLAYNDLLVNGTSFKLTCNVTDDQNNPVSSYYKVTFYLNGTKIGETTANKGVATLDVSKYLDNGKYSLTGSYGDENPLECDVVDGTVTVDFDHNPVEYWVSATGNDENGTGSESNPFKTLKHALDIALTDSVDITIRMKDGLYNETGDYGLSYSNVAKIAIIGENYGKTIISANNNGRFVTFGVNTDVYMKNLKLVNATGTSYRSFDVRYLTMEKCILDNVQRFYAQTSPSHIVFRNVTWTNSQQLMMYNPEIYDSVFENIVSSGTGNLWLATANDDDWIIIENSKFINMTCTGYSGCGVAYVSGNFKSTNNLFDSNKATRDSGALYVSANQIISINDTFINNHADEEYGAASFYPNSENATCYIENAKFINNTAGTNGGAIAVYGGEIINTVFENNVAGANGGAIVMPTHSSSVYLYDLTLSDVSFKNNNATDGADIYITPSSNANNLHCNLNGMTVTLNDLTTKTLEDEVSADVTHESGAVISGGVVTFYMDGSRMGEAVVQNGVAKLDFLGFKNNGTFALSGNYSNEAKDTKYVNGTITVALDPLKDNVTLYVSDAKGDDVKGTGSIDAPYKTIQTALINGYKQSAVIVVRVLEGTYSGEGNTNLTVASSLDITIVGDGRNKTLIDGKDLDWFLNIATGNGIVKVANMTVANVTMNYVDAKKYNQHPAISIEKDAVISIENIEFIRCHGTEGGAIFNEGTMSVKDSLFFNNGDSNNGGAIKNMGTLTVYSSEFIANHAKYYATIYNDGEMFLYDSLIQDSMRVNGWTGNAMAIGGKGNITMVNTTLSRSGKTCDELIGAGQTWANNPGFAISIGSTGNVKVINSTIDGNDINYKAQYISNVAFGGSGSIGVFVPYGLEVVNTKILNLKDIISASKGTNLIDSCYIENVTYVSEGTSYDYNMTVVNSYFADGTTMVTKKDTSNVVLNNNWWGSNDKPVYKVGSDEVSPDTWLVIALDVNDAGELQKDVILSFKVSDGENVSDFDASAFARQFTIAGENATVNVSGGEITDKVTVPVVAQEGKGYKITASVDNQTVDLTRLYAELTPSAEPVYVGQNVTVEIAVPENVTGTVTVTIDGKKYAATVNGTKAIAIIPDLAIGNYTASVALVNDDVYFSKVTNLDIKVLGIEINAPDVEKYFKGSQNLVIAVTDSEGNVLAGEKLLITIGGKEYDTTTNASGIATLDLDMAVGKYTAEIALNSTNASASITIKSTVPEENPTESKIANNGFEVKFLDSEGNPLASTSVVISVNGKNITKKTDANGIAKLTKAQIGSKAGSYTIAAYNPVTNETAAYNVKIINRLTGNKNINMYYFDGTKYSVNVYGDNGKLVGKNQIVVVKIGKKTYKVKTNAKGKAILKIPSTITPGKYTITAKYKDQTVKNTLKVKQNLKTTKSVKVKKSAKKLILKATLKNGKKAVKGKVITFKFKGKNYKAKTDKKGIAKVTIKKNVINKLKVGKKYALKVVYLKNTVKATVKVRR